MVFGDQGFGSARWGLEKEREGRAVIDVLAVRRHLTCVTSTISSKGQIVLPATLRERDGIAAGQQFEIERLGAGEYLLKRRLPESNAGLVEWLLSCPHKGWFQPIESESTDTL